MASQVFIAHSTKDAVWLSRLTTMLVPLGRFGLSCWDETKIEPGQHRQEQIAAALAGARVVVLLVSPDFLAFNPIFEQELSAVLADTSGGQRLKILWVSVRPCLWQQSVLASYLPVNDPDKPLVGLAENEADRILVTICRQIRAAVGISVDVAGNPYRGLSAFQAHESHLFFGREALTERLCQRYASILDNPEATRLLTIMGPSGSGKSSVAQAGLLAALLHAENPKQRPYATVILKPGERPIESLARALTPLLPTDNTVLAASRVLSIEQLLRNTVAPGEGLRRLAAEQSQLAQRSIFVLVDQFEEVYTLCHNQADRDLFVALLLDATQPQAGKIVVVLSLRSDFLGETQQYHHQLNRLIADQGVLVSVMGPEELRATIAQPAEHAGRPIDETTIQLLLSQAGGSQGALPLLEFALTRIWEGMDYGEEPVVTLGKLGGVGGALAREAHRIYHALTPTEQATARRALVRLVRLGEGTRDTRRRVALRELCGKVETEHAVLAVLRKFAEQNARLITLSSDSGEVIAEVTHEALFDHWQALRGWIDEGRADRRFHDRLSEAAHLWNEDRSQMGRLWRPPDLDLLSSFAERKSDDLTTLDQEFLIAAQLARHAELAERQQHVRLLRNGLAVVASLLAIAIIIVVYALIQRDRAEQRELDMVVENSRQILVEKSRPVEALLRLERAKERGSRSPILTELIADAARPLDAVKMVLQGHSGLVQSASFSPDGRRIITSTDFTVKVWDSQTGQLVTTLKGLSNSIYRASFSPDGRRIVTTSADQSVRVWDAQTGQMIAVLQGLSDAIYYASFSPDGSRIVAASADSTARVWDAETGRLVATLKGHSSNVTDAVYSPDGSRIVTGSDDNSARVWNAQTGELVTTLLGHSGPVSSVTYSPDGHRIITASPNDSVRVWDAQTGQLVAVLRDSYHSVSMPSYSPDGRRIVSIGNADRVQIWDAKTGKLELILAGHSDQITSASYSPDGRRIVTSSWDRTSRVWDALTGQLINTLHGHSDKVTSASYSPDGHHIVTSSWDQTARVWDAQTSQLSTTLQSNWGQSGNYSPDGLRIVTGYGDTARVWDAQTGQLINSLHGFSSSVTIAKYSPDGRYILAAGRNSAILIWDAQTGQIVNSLHGPSGPILSAAFSPDGRHILTGYQDTTVRMWDVRSGQLANSLQMPSGPVYSAAYSPDGSHIVTSNWNTALVWDVRTGQMVNSLRGHTNFVRSAQYSPDGRRIVTGSVDGTARVWESLTGQPITILQGHKGTVESASYSPDGQHIVTGSDDHTARVWDAQTGQVLAILQGHTSYVTSASYSPDGRRIATGSWDGTVRISDVASVLRSTQEIHTLLRCRSVEKLQGEVVISSAIIQEACMLLPPRAPRLLTWDQRDAAMWTGIYALQVGRVEIAKAALQEARQQLEHFQDFESLAKLTLAEAALAAKDEASSAPASIIDFVNRTAPEKHSHIWLELAEIAHNSLYRTRWARWSLGEMQREGHVDPDVTSVALAYDLEFRLVAGEFKEVLQSVTNVLAVQGTPSNKAVVAALAWVASMQQSSSSAQQIWARRAIEFYSECKDNKSLGWTFDGSRQAFLSQPGSPSRTAALELFTLLEQRKSSAITERLGRLLGVSVPVCLSDSK